MSDHLFGRIKDSETPTDTLYRAHCTCGWRGQAYSIRSASADRRMQDDWYFNHKLRILDEVRA